MTPTTELDADTATRLRVSIGRLARGLNAPVAGAEIDIRQRFDSLPRKAPLVSALGRSLSGDRGQGHECEISPNAQHPQDNVGLGFAIRYPQ